MLKNKKNIPKKINSNKIKTEETTKLIKPKKVKYKKTTKKHISEMSKFKFDSLKLEISIIQKFTENLDVPIIKDLDERD